MPDAHAKIIFFDLDGTLIPGNSWRAFNMRFGVSESEDAMLYDFYHRGIITYQEWINLIVRMLQERRLCLKEEYDGFVETLVPREGARELIAACKAKGYITAILSGALYQSSQAIALSLGIDHVYTTASIDFGSDGLVSGIELHTHMNEFPVKTITHEGLAKRAIFEEVCVHFGADPKEAIHVGDGGNDMEIFKLTKKGIQIGEFESLAPLAWKRVDALSEIAQFL